MNVTGIKYTGIITSPSGFGNASRNYVCALYKAGYNVWANPYDGNVFKADYGDIQEIVEPLFKQKMKKDKYNVHIISSMPDTFSKLIDNNQYNIGLVVWETEQYPKHKVEACNIMNEIWTASEWNKKVLIDNGVTKPVFVVPHTQNLSAKKDTKNWLVVEHNPEQFIFYSIFQWHERKNPFGLIKAFYYTFEKEDNVILVLKTSPIILVNKKINDIRNDITAIKQGMHLNYYPSIKLITDELPEWKINAIHEQGHCFVLPHRGEGWGLPAQEAMIHNSYVITTGYSGCTEFAKPEFCDLLDYRLQPGMIEWSTYIGKHLWADPDILQLSKKMRAIYDAWKTKGEAWEVYKEKMRLAREYQQRFDWMSVGNLIKERLEAI